MRRKDKALAELTAIVVLKKTGDLVGRGKGALTSSSVRSHLVALVAEAMAAGARLKVIGEHLRIDHRTLQRWRKDPAGDGRKDAVRKVHNKLTDAERAEILRVVNLPEYRDMAPAS
ncbi:MAG: hypothetical protein HS115_07070 [Spirochaetales bacterium]|nr:hypothetical protein [Spirochaetales bacterium]